jgi:hypothetical protein
MTESKDAVERSYQLLSKVHQGRGHRRRLILTTKKLCAFRREF